MSGAGAPRFSIGIPFAATPLVHLELAVRSVFAQTVDDWELLLVSDGHHPALEAHLARVRDARVRLVREPDNRGLAARLNQVARLATGEVLVRMDGDDLMHPERLRRTADLLGRSPAAVVGGRAVAIDARTQVLGLFAEGGLPLDRAGFLRSNAFTHPTVAASRRWFLEHPYDESLRRSEDKDLWLRASRDSTFVKSQDVLLFYRLADLGPAKQGRDARQDRGLLRRHGPALVGHRRTAAKVVASHGKQAVFAALSRLGAEQAIVRRKVVALSEAERLASQEALRRATSARVPGWDE